MRAAILGDVVMDAGIWEAVKWSTTEAERRPKVIQALVEHGRASHTINLAQIPADVRVSLRLYQHLLWQPEVAPARLQANTSYMDLSLRSLGESTFETTANVHSTYDDTGGRLTIPPGSAIQLVAHDPYGQPTETARYHRPISAVYDAQLLTFRYTDITNRNPNYTSDPCVIGSIKLDGQSVFVEDDDI